MARAEIRTLLPLDLFAKLVGLHPLHFNQVYVDNLAAATDATMPLLQYNWQEVDRVSREDLAKEIKSAEDQIEALLGFSPLPRWYTQQLATTNNPSLLNTKGQWWNEQLEAGFIRSGGVESWLLLGTEAIVYSDVDGDGYDETATVTLATTLTVSDEISVCYPGKDSATWEIRPRKVVIAGGIATITFRREQAVIAARLLELAPRGVDGLDDAQFLKTVDVYRHWNDPQTQATLIWNDFVTPGVVQTQTGCLTLRDARLGIVHVQPATWVTSAFVAACPYYSVRPNRVILNYYAGWYKDSLVTIDSLWAYAITALTCSQLDRPLCGGDTTQALIKYWKEDMLLRYSDGTQVVSWATPKQVLENPLGGTRAAAYVWRLIKQYNVRQ